MDKINGTKIILTGCASGMGAALVEPLLSAGAHIVGLDINPVDDSLRCLEATGKVHFLSCDVSSKASVDAAFKQAFVVLGGIDTLIHAAGITKTVAAAEITPEAWDELFAVNARGTLLTNQAAFRLFRGGGRIINFASGAGITGLPNMAHYSATKGAVIAWSRTAAKEWGRHNVTVNMVSPAISTPMYVQTRAEMSEEQLTAMDLRLAADMPIDGKLGDAERDFVPLLLFLCSPGARFITGQIIAVDGGLVMVR